jgi:hypothetical protein
MNSEDTILRAGESVLRFERAFNESRNAHRGKPALFFHPACRIRQKAALDLSNALGRRAELATGA